MPVNDQHFWGPTNEFYNYNLTLTNKNRGVIYISDTDNYNNKLIIESNEKMSVTYDIYNSSNLKINQNSVKFEQIEDRFLKFTFNLSQFGIYKLMIYGKPSSHAGNSLPLLAIFLIENNINNESEYSLYKKLLCA